jgi:hypothetical protein
VTADDVEAEGDSGEAAADEGVSEAVTDEGGDVAGDIMVVGINSIDEHVART